MRSLASHMIVLLALCAATPAQARQSIVSATHGQIRNLEGAVIHYQTENRDECPASIEELVSQKILSRPPRDAWGRPFWIECPGRRSARGVDVASLGSDGIPGTDDDISNWDDGSPKVLVMPRRGLKDIAAGLLECARSGLVRIFE